MRGDSWRPRATIHGSGFGDNPEVNAGWWAMVSVQWANGVEIHGTVSVDPNAPDTMETVTVTSRGWGGQGFMPAPGASQTANATVQIRSAGAGACPYPASEVSETGHWCSSCVGGVFTAKLKDAGGATPPAGKYQGRTVRERLSDLVDTCYFDGAEWRAVLPEEPDWSDWQVGSINGYGSDLISLPPEMAVYYHNQVCSGRYGSCYVSIRQTMQIRSCDGSSWVEYHSQDTRNTISSDGMTATRGNASMSGPIGGQ